MNDQRTTLYLVRHGTTDLNAAMCYQGRVDVPLNDLGLAQGRCLTEYFRDIAIDKGVVSPLIRARQTMDALLAEKPEVPVTVEPDIIELDGGEIEERPFREINVIWPGFLDAFTTHPGTYRMPGGESGADVYHRVIPAIQRIARENQGKTVVVVSHGFAISTWINYMQGIPAEEMKEATMDNVAVSKFTFDADFVPTTDFIGDSRHLPAAMRQNFDWDELAIPRPVFLCYTRCSTCKKAEKFLEAHGVAVQKREIAEERLRSLELLTLMDRFDGEPRKFFNTSGMRYRELGLKDKVGTMDREAMAALLATDGMLVKRPQLIFTDKVLLGFNEKAWSEALGL